MNRTGKRRKRRVKKYLTLLIAVLILAIAGTIGLGIWKKSNRKEQIQTPAYCQDREKKDFRFRGLSRKRYEYNDHLSNFLFIGIDKK